MQFANIVKCTFTNISKTKININTLRLPHYLVLVYDANNLSLISVQDNPSRNGWLGNVSDKGKVQFENARVAIQCQ